ncbi:hypothetical protein COF67_19635 [Bacillus toyonensis]|nr:hypothetical protein COF67_19635 [Bacillus toyonensis]
MRQLNQPAAYVVWDEKDVWLNLGGEQWIKNDRSYVEFEEKSAVDSSIVGKRVVFKVNNLFKVHNSIGKTYYITINEVYI